MSLELRLAHFTRENPIKFRHVPFSKKSIDACNYMYSDVSSCVGLPGELYVTL